MKFIRRLFLRIFPRYYRYELRCFTWTEANMCLRDNSGKPERDQWRIAPEEDRNIVPGIVFLERRERIKE